MLVMTIPEPNMPSNGCSINTAKKDIAKSIEEYKQGKIFTFEEVKAELGLK